MDREKTKIKLKELSWEDLDWLERKCRAYKKEVDGPKVFSNTGDTASQMEGMRALHNFFEGAKNW